MKSYILVTPCKNEEESLPKLAESVINQTIRPVLWVIVDDGSTDKTPQIIQKLVSESPWIKTIKLTENPRDLGIHLAHVYRTGFQYAIKYCKSNNLEYEYIGVVDADIILSDNYFESLIAEFERNPKLGISSGRIGNIVEGKILWEPFREDLPSGGARLWRRKCFEETGGYLPTCSPDSVSNVKAKLQGWEIKKFKHIKAISTRPYAGAEGQWKGYKKLGANNYFIGYTPTHVILKGLTMLYSKNGYFKTGAGIAYILGYLTEYLRRAPRINDPEIIEYYRRNRLKEIICSRFQRNTR